MTPDIPSGVSNCVSTGGASEPACSKATRKRTCHGGVIRGQIWLTQERDAIVPTADERFNRIYETQYLAVLAYCARRVNHSEVEEVANEVFVTLWRRIDSFDETLPLPWLYRVAYGVIRNRWRTIGRTARLRARLSGLAPDLAESPEEVVMRREQDRLVLAALYSLRPPDRELLRLLMWEELAVAEIAATVGCSVSAAAQRLHRAKQRLARAISPHSPATSRSTQSAEQGGTR